MSWPPTNKNDWKKFVVPEAEPLNIPRFTSNIFNYGPEELRLRENLVQGGGPEEFVRNNPQLFATGTTSRDEGWFYWGMLHEIGPEAVPGNNGFIWFYQSKVAGGNNRPGGAIIDFLVRHSGRRMDMGIRIVTPYRHTLAGPERRGIDAAQAVQLRRMRIEVIDVHSKNYVGISEAAVMQSVQKALRGESDAGPLFRQFRP